MTKIKTLKSDSKKVKLPSIKELEDKYDLFTEELFGSKEKNIAPKFYKVELSEIGLNYLKYVIENTTWKGLGEAIQLNAIEEFLSEKSKDNSYKNLDLNFDLIWSELNHLYTFMINLQGTGIKDAKSYFELINQLTIPMDQLRKEQQQLKDIVLEIQAAQNGISVEELVKNIEKI